MNEWEAIHEMSKCEDYNFDKWSCGLWLCMTMYHVKCQDLINNSLIVVRGAGSDIQSYRDTMKSPH